MSHTITFRPSGRTLECAGDVSILAAGLEAGAGLPFSCRSGVCRTCRGRMIAGRVDFGPVHPNYLTEQEKAAGIVHLCQARPLSDCVIEVDEFDPALSLPAKAMPSRVMAIERLAPDVIALQLGLPPNEPLRFHAGQYIDILLNGGARRSYSIATAPVADGVRQIELHIRHMPGGVFTDHVFSALKLRDLCRLEAPHGTFFLRAPYERPIVLLASGTGFAPIQSMIEFSLARGIERPMHLYWGGRSRADLYRHELALGWARDHPHIRYTPVLSDATPRCAWAGRTGFVHHAVLQDFSGLGAYEVYACGAPVMVDAARRDFTSQAHLDPRDFFADSFVTEADKAPGPTTQPSLAA
jgi:CDP-4-dehydro-6-deoxyglucose reductase, E3